MSHPPDETSLLTLIKLWNSYFEKALEVGEGDIFRKCLARVRSALPREYERIIK
jgi:hypothetical protein